MLLKTGEEFVNKLEERKDKAYKEYLKIINKLENETQIVQWYHDVLVDCSNLLNLNVETIHDISSLSSDKYPWSTWNERN
jgi:energy-converting hydrogenase A subunit M